MASPRGIRIDVDQRGICTGVTSDVAGALQDDLERMLDQQERPVELRLDGETRPSIQHTRRPGALEIDQGADVRPKVVVLTVHTRLELRQLHESLLESAAAEKLASGLQSQVDAGEGLHELVVQRPRDALTLGRGLEVAES